MSRRPDKFYPGWKMTPAQHASYFNLLEGVYRAYVITKSADKETMRKKIHQQAFGRPVSAKDIDHMKMFDEFKAVCLAMSQPDNLDAQMHQAEQPLIRLRHAILKFSEAYTIGMLCSPRFKKHGLDDLNHMTEKELTDLRNTLSARSPKSSSSSSSSSFSNQHPEPVEEGDPF
jgi:hypothetical protein